MQYSFALPADYDMSIVERRVRDKGHALDDHALLAFKAYLVARQGDPVTGSRENLYAPFYLWRDGEGMRDFLASPGFGGLAKSFGWPVVRTWPALLALTPLGDLAAARYASRRVLPVAPFADLAELREGERRLALAAVGENKALLALTALEPTTWTLVRFTLWRDSASLPDPDDAQRYDVLHVSHPVRT